MILGNMGNSEVQLWRIVGILTHFIFCVRIPRVCCPWHHIDWFITNGNKIIIIIIASSVTFETICAFAVTQYVSSAVLHYMSVIPWHIKCTLCQTTHDCELPYHMNTCVHIFACLLICMHSISFNFQTHYYSIIEYVILKQRLRKKNIA